jgi:hypothetical protein
VIFNNFCHFLDKVVCLLTNQTEAVIEIDIY